MPEVILKNLPFLLAGLRLTAEIALLSIAGGTLLGLAIGVLRYLRVPLIAQSLDLYVLFMRGTPLLMVLFICYFGLPVLFGYKTSAYWARSAGLPCSSPPIWPRTSAPDCDRCRLASYRQRLRPGSRAPLSCA
jgi:His/Glu/Gln/Arg/opine family amino acid ABC transporter permease subunit